MKTLKKYNMFKFTALFMAFVWLFGAYATGMMGVHATDEINYPGEDNNNYIGDEYFGENDVEANQAEAGGDSFEPISPLSVGWTQPINTPPLQPVRPVLERRDWQDHGDLNDAPRVPVNFNRLILTSDMNFSQIHSVIFNCPVRQGCPNTSTIRPDCPYERFAAFRLWHFQQDVLPYLDMCRYSSMTLQEHPTREWGVGNFQYAYVQWLHFNTNFGLDGVHTPDELGGWDSRMVIMGNFYDRMFVNSRPPHILCYESGYGTLRNYLFPMTPACVANPPAADVQPSFTNLTHPEGKIFGGWFTPTPGNEGPYNANNLGSQEGRFFERTEDVTTQLHRTLYARWYPLPTVEKAVSPGQLTHEDVERGIPVFYTITIDTHGLPSDMIDLLVEDTLDERLTLVEGSVRIQPAVGPPEYTNDDGALSFYISDILGPVRGIDRIVITFKATVNPDVITPETNEIIRISNTAILYGPPGPGNGEREELDRDDTIFEIPVPPVPPVEYPDDCDCPECECPCECPECECECDCEEVQQRPGKVSRPAGKAPATGDLTSTIPLFAGLLFSMSAVLGGTSLRRRFKR